MDPNISFETRIVNDTPIQVAIYTGTLHRVDKEDDPWYVSSQSSAPFKYFTTTEKEATNAYSKHGQILRRYRPTRPLVLVNLYDLATRNAILRQMDELERPHMEFSFPLKNGNTRVSRRSEEGQTHHNYGVSNVICKLFAEHGIDGYFIERGGNFHSEIMICKTSLIPDILTYEGQRRVSSKPLKRSRSVWVQEYNGVAMNDPVAVNGNTDATDTTNTYLYYSPPRAKRPTTWRARRATRRATRRTRRH